MIPSCTCSISVAQEGCGINIRDTAAIMPAPAIWKARTRAKLAAFHPRALDAFTGKKVWDMNKSLRPPLRAGTDVHRRWC